MFDALNFGSYAEVDDVPCPHSEYTPEQCAADRTSEDTPFIDELNFAVVRIVMYLCRAARFG
jgi:hypothetical protein